VRWSLVSLCWTSVALAEPSGSGDDVDDPAAWLAARGVTALTEQAKSWCCCSEVVVGSASERALRCSEPEDSAIDGTYTIAVHDVVRVVRGGKAVIVLDAWTSLRNLDLRPGSPPIVELSLTIGRDGRTVTLIDGGGGRDACPHRSGTSRAALFDKWIERICHGRGTPRGLVRQVDRAHMSRPRHVRVACGAIRARALDQQLAAPPVRDLDVVEVDA
jgi:hypothetical protein